MEVVKGYFLYSAVTVSVIVAVVVAFIGCKSMTDSLEKDVYHELRVAAKGLSNYYGQEISNSEDQSPVYDHNYVDSLLDDDIQLCVM